MVKELYEPFRMPLSSTVNIPDELFPFCFKAGSTSHKSLTGVETFDLDLPWTLKGFFGSSSVPGLFGGGLGVVFPENTSGDGNTIVGVVGMLCDEKSMVLSPEPACDQFSRTL